MFYAANYAGLNEPLAKPIILISVVGNRADSYRDSLDRLTIGWLDQCRHYTIISCVSITIAFSQLCRYLKSFKIILVMEHFSKWLQGTMRLPRSINFIIGLQKEKTIFLLHPLSTSQRGMIITSFYLTTKVLHALDILETLTSIHYPPI